MTQRIAFEIEKKKTLETARTRRLIGGALMTAAFMVVGLRLVDLAAFSTVENLRSHTAREVVRPQPTSRAEIVDRNGILLASNLATASLYANPHRSDARRVGNECVSTCRSRWSQDHSKKKKSNSKTKQNT